MSMIKPLRWSPRALLGVQLPHLFRKPKSPQEWIGPSNERVPLDAHEQHMYITRLQKSFKKDILTRYGINQRPAECTNKFWSILTGEWVPESWIHPTHIYPPALGSMLREEIMGPGPVWQGNNGLMLPKPIKKALDDWALTIVPDDVASTSKDMDYRWKVVDPSNEGLRVQVYPKYQYATELMGVDIDGRLLAFRGNARPLSAILYFHCCCAIWKRTCLQNPDISDVDEFSEIFLGAMKELWGEKMVNYTHGQITMVFKPRKEGELRNEITTRDSSYDMEVKQVKREKPKKFKREEAKKVRSDKKDKYDKYDRNDRSERYARNGTSDWDTFVRQANNHMS
ncbi:hypothetical protein VMCG_05717 [Cytospora schulzeri]|uniref:HNH nuclease domain-containing protein n=1 Tax=Cytospora schulzeri TaxID=448051 RepID=A0A423WHU9_9PEZI|nr:hypothetical protein VMCG_05717 [Valsa malicola]